MRFSFVNGMGAHQFRKSLASNYMREYHEHLLKFLSLTHSLKEKGIDPISFGQFSRFDDPTGYLGKIPSSTFLRDIYISFMDGHRDNMDRQLMKISGRILKGKFDT